MSCLVKKIKKKKIKNKHKTIEVLYLLKTHMTKNFFNSHLFIFKLLDKTQAIEWR